MFPIMHNLAFKMKPASEEYFDQMFPPDDTSGIELSKEEKDAVIQHLEYMIEALGSLSYETLNKFKYAIIYFKGLKEK